MVSPPRAHPQLPAVRACSAVGCAAPDRFHRARITRHTEPPLPSNTAEQTDISKSTQTGGVELIKGDSAMTTQKPQASRIDRRQTDAQRASASQGFVQTVSWQSDTGQHSTAPAAFLRARQAMLPTYHPHARLRTSPHPHLQAVQASHPMIEYHGTAPCLLSVNAAKGVFARVSNHVFHCVEAVEARARQPLAKGGLPAKCRGFAAIEAGWGGGWGDDRSLARSSTYPSNLAAIFPRLFFGLSEIPVPWLAKFFLARLFRQKSQGSP
jgi:hypothetical protein